MNHITRQIRVIARMTATRPQQGLVAGVTEAVDHSETVVVARSRLTTPQILRVQTLEAGDREDLPAHLGTTDATKDRRVIHNPRG